jgi:uncharacterized protein
MDTAERKVLLKLARDSIKTYYSQSKPDLSQVKHMSVKQGVIVTIYDKSGKLRGIKSYASPANPIYISVAEASRGAAFADSRFGPLSKDELADCKLEIALLGKPERIIVSHYNDYLKSIRIGIDGLAAENPYGPGLLLPRVAVENNFNVQSFLNCACQKAGLGFYAWREPHAKIYKFEAEVFSE